MLTLGFAFDATSKNLMKCEPLLGANNFKREHRWLSSNIDLSDILKRISIILQLDKFSSLKAYYDPQSFFHYRATIYYLIVLIYSSIKISKFLCMIYHQSIDIQAANKSPRRSEAGQFTRQ